MKPLATDIAWIYRHHHGWLHGWLRRRLGCADHAADLAHDTFTRILASNTAAPIQEPRAFLTTVAKGILVNWYRRQALERAYLEALALLPPAHAPSEERRRLVLESLLEVDTMLDALPPAVRHVFLLSQLEGLKYDDIAARIGLSLSTVKRHMHQAFRQCLALMD